MNLSPTQVSRQQHPLEDARLNDLRVAVIGGGAYGTFVTHLLSDGRGDFARPRSLNWCVRRPEVADAINVDRRNTQSGLSEQLREVTFPDAVRATTELGVAVEDADIVVVCISSDGLKDLARELKSTRHKEGVIFILTQKSLLLKDPPAEDLAQNELPQLPTDLFSRALGSRAEVAFFSGAGYADDLILDRDSSKRLVVSARDAAMADGLARLLSTQDLAVKAHEGMQGVSVGVL